MKNIDKSPKEKENGFGKFLLERNPSQKFVRTYGIYLRSQVVRRYVLENSHTDDIFQVTDMNELLDIYDALRIDDNNIRLHNVYSGAVSAYIKYLDGKPLRIKAKKKEENEIQTEA